ncbi:MAG: SMC family ATPase [Clostridia bacterium]|jgi:exonuclease SbcC|nr:SMC family ATPase [Clostridia bacterium]
MKPINLKISAFGPYKDEVNIDFTKLGENGIFLITGDTGAGKTSIFDAISFAIFGEVSGSNRPIQTLRSDFADINIDTYVELEFVHKNRKYKILRNPSYEKPKKKGEGFTKKSADASLEYDDVVVSGIKNVDIKIEEILGINAKQFKQISMLAQGEFLKILFAESKERTEIFRKIFDTNIYNSIARKLKEKLKINEDELKELKNSFITNTANILWEKEKYINLDSKINEIDIDNVLKELEQELEENKEENTNIEEEITKQEREIKVIEENISKQEELNLKIENYKQLLTKQNEYKKQEEEIEKLKNKIAQNQKIREIIKPKADKVNNEKEIIKKLEKDLDTIKRNIQIGNAKEKEHEKKVEIVNKIGEKYKEYNNYLEIKKELLEKANIIKNIENLEITKNNYLKEYEQLEKEYKIINNEYLEKESEFFKEQVGIIAEKLEENKPCPVCGSITHPNIAKKSASVLSKEELEKIKENLEIKQNNKLKKQEECIKVNSQINILIQEIGKESDNKLELESAKNKLKEEFNINKEKLISIEQTILKEYKSILNKDLDITKFEYDKFKDSIIDLINLEKNELVKSKTLQEEKMNQLQESNLRLDKYTKEYFNELLKLRFKNEEEYNKILLTNIEIENIQKNIEDFTRNVAINNTKISDLEKEAKGKSTKDLKIQKEKLMAYKNILIEKRKEYVKVKGKLDNNMRIYKLLLENAKELKQKIKDFIIYDELSRTANGTLAGKKRIEFEQYVQATYFDMVILEANKRLAKMTENRYFLIRKEEPEKISDKIGLDLEVKDNYNGKIRDVKSLSGGEAFKAALSLALGLSDVIQSYSGGIVVDTLFIDEGFGSLDTESREQAINTLSLLIDNNKLIGIISHVTELKERIDKKIIVTKTSDGSKIEIES